VNPKAVFTNSTILNADFVDWLFTCYKFSHVFHCAAYAAEGLSPFIRQFNYKNNLIGSVNLINSAIRHRCKCFVFTSSIAVYGSQQSPMVETTMPYPQDPYGIAKYAVELDLMAAKHQFGLDYIIFRPHNVYGERQNIGDLYRNVVGIFMNQIMQGKPCTIFGSGEQVRAFTHISDVAPVIAKSIKYPSRAYNQVFNVGSDIPCSVNRLAEIVQNAMEKNTGVEYLPPRKEVFDAFSNHDKLKIALEYYPRVSLAQGLYKMATWAEKHGIRYGRPFENIEIQEGLPESWRSMCKI